MPVTDFGFGLLTCQRYPGDPRRDAELYREAIDLAVEAERLDFDSVWTSEHHFFDDSYASSQLPFLAAIAARTSRILIGPCVLLAPLYDPIHLAEDAATVDLIADGRLVLGLGLGWREEEFDGFGVSLTERVRRLEGSVVTLRQAWADSATVGDGAIFRLPELNVTPKPARAGGPPIWFGALVEPAIRRAARIADGFVATKVTPEQFGQQVRWALEELERERRDPSTFVFAVHHPVFAWTDGDAWDRVGPYADYMDWKYSDMSDARSRIGWGAAPPADATRTVAARRGGLWGPPDRVADGIAAYADAAGVDVHFIARSSFPGLEPGVQRETLRILGAEVIPMVRGAAVARTEDVEASW